MRLGVYGPRRPGVWQYFFFTFIFLFFLAEVAAPVLATATASTGARFSSLTRADIQIDYY